VIAPSFTAESSRTRPPRFCKLTLAFVLVSAVC